MKLVDVVSSCCPIMSFRSTEAWVACKGPGCACWETIERKLEEMVYDISDHEGFFYREDLPWEIRDAGWCLRGVVPVREPDGRYTIRLYRYTDILEGECGLTHPREG